MKLNDGHRYSNGNIMKMPPESKRFGKEIEGTEATVLCKYTNIGQGSCGLTLKLTCQRLSTR